MNIQHEALKKFSYQIEFALKNYSAHGMDLSKYDYFYVNGSSFTEISSIVDVDVAERYKKSILSDCNKQKESLGEQIAKLKSQFDEL
jgi:predicted rRNA methylase YqxC with S4 and FtsJ domains